MESEKGKHCETMSFDNRDVPSAPPHLATRCIFSPSVPMPEGSEVVRGYNFNGGVDYHKLIESFKTVGFQATNFNLAVEEINRMIECKKQPIPADSPIEFHLNPIQRERSNCTIMLGYTSNMISAGVREIIRFLAQHNMVDCIVTTAGGIEEDFIKCLGEMYIGSFRLKGGDLYEKAINRTGNLLVPNENYIKFQKWIKPVLDNMLEEQREQGTLWTPSRMIARLGQEIDDTDSVYYWAYKNNIPVFCPAITDGALGDALFLHSFENPGLVIDLVKDIRLMDSQAVYAQNTGMIILGGGIVKHHICNANCLRSGANFSVFVNTASEFDGSDAGARPDEAVSWGKIKADANPVKVHGEATLIFPFLVAETFAREFYK